MSLTVNPIRAAGRLQRLDVPGDQAMGLVELVGDTAYPTNGYAITPALLGLIAIDWFVPICCSGGLIPVWDQANQKLKLFYPSGGGAASPASIADPAIASGATTVTSAAANGSTDLVPGQGKELANNTNVSTIKVYALVEGR
jgi:hypothetical protein